MKEANGARSAIGGDFNNSATGSSATIPGGNGNSATNYSFAAGRYPNAEHDGTFVWGSAPGILATVTESFAENSFTVRCQGGARFYTANGTGTGAWLKVGLSSWDVASDSNAKTKVTRVSPREVLARLAGLPVTECEYKSAPQRRFLGPMAQDFHAAFGLGNDDKTINTLDADGVLFLSVKGLVEELKERDKVIEELKAKSADVAELKAELRALREELRGGLPPTRWVSASVALDIVDNNSACERTENVLGRADVPRVVLVGFEIASAGKLHDKRQIEAVVDEPPGVGGRCSPS